MASKKVIKLINGVEIPKLGFGTWLAEPSVTGEGVKTALRLGYRHIDCASRYLNEPEIGEALTKTFNRNQDIKRSSVFLTGKLWSQDFHRVREACEQSLKDLQVDYLDQYLVHHPVGIKPDCSTFFPEKGEDLIPWEASKFQETWHEMEKLYKKGLVRSIGVCNFTKHKVSKLLERLPEVRPHTVQNEIHPHLPQRNLIDYCRAEGISCTGFASLGNRERPPQMIDAGDTVLLEDPTVGAIAQKHKVSNAQVLLAWGMQRDVSVLTRSVHEREIQDSFNAMELELDSEDIEQINGIKARCRYLKAKWYCLDGQSLDQVWDDEVLG